MSISMEVLNILMNRKADHRLKDTGYSEGDITLVWERHRTPDDTYTYSRQARAVIESDGTPRRIEIQFRPDGYWSDISVIYENNAYSGERVDVQFGSGGRCVEDAPENHEVGIVSPARAALSFALTLKAAAAWAQRLEGSHIPE
jgi:hypothetical protein